MTRSPRRRATVGPGATGWRARTSAGPRAPRAAPWRRRRGVERARRSRALRPGLRRPVAPGEGAGRRADPASVFSGLLLAAAAPLTYRHGLRMPPWSPPARPRPPLLERATTGQRTSERDLVGVLQIAPDGQSGREPRHRHVGRALVHASGDVQRRRLARRGRVGGQNDLAHVARLQPRVELADLEVVRLDAVDRRQRAAEHVVAAAELVRALDRDDVARVLDDADERAVPARVGADLAARALGQVEADFAETDAFLDLADRVGERERV